MGQVFIGAASFVVRESSAKATIRDIVLQLQSAFERQLDGVYELQVSPLYIFIKLDWF